MIELIISLISAIATAASAIISAIALRSTMNIQKEMREDNIKQNTIKEFNILQNEVFDRLVSLNRKNAEIIVQSLTDNEECKKAYDDYRPFIARLEHFAVGVKNKVYDFDIVNELAGEHLISVYNKVEPIILETNKKSKTKKFYINYIELVNNLKSLRRNFK